MPLRRASPRTTPSAAGRKRKSLRVCDFARLLFVKALFSESASGAVDLCKQIRARRVSGSCVGRGCPVHDRHDVRFRIVESARQQLFGKRKL